MERIHARALETENRVRMLETDGMRLQLYQNMLTNISTQATLLLGFALATFGADLLPYILDDTAVYCIYKSWYHQLIGALFLTTNTCCVSFCLLVVIFSSFLIHRSQEAFLHIGGSVAVYRTQNLIHRIYVWYACALGCFIWAAILLLWIFLGLPGYVDHTGVYEESDVTTFDGRVLTACLNKEDYNQVELRRNIYGLVVTAFNTFVFIGYILYGYNNWTSMNRSFVLDLIRGEEAVMKEEHAVKIKAAAGREVTVAKYRLEAANAELRAVKADPKRDSTAETRVLKAQKAAAQRLSIAQKRLKENQSTLSRRIGERLVGVATKNPDSTSVVRLPAPASQKKFAGKTTGLSSGSLRIAAPTPEAAVPAAGAVPPSLANVAALSTEPPKPKDDEVDSTA